MQQQYIPQQQGAILVQNVPFPNDNRLTPTAVSQMRGLSITQVVMGGLCVLFGIILVAVEYSALYSYYGGWGVISYGIWCGAYFIVVGAIGLGAVRSNSECMIIAAMVLNIICSSTFWVILLSLSAVGISFNSSYGYSYSYRYGYSSSEKAELAFNSLMLVMAIIELIVCIWSAALCCGAVCRCCKTGSAAQNNQRVVMQPQHQLMMATGPVHANAYPAGQQQAVQGQYGAYPAPVHQQQMGYVVQPQVPPTYQETAQGSTTSQQLDTTNFPNAEYPSKN